MALRVTSNSRKLVKAPLAAAEQLEPPACWKHARGDSTHCREAAGILLDNAAEGIYHW